MALPSPHYLSVQQYASGEEERCIRSLRWKQSGLVPDHLIDVDGIVVGHFTFAFRPSSTSRRRSIPYRASSASACKFPSPMTAPDMSLAATSEWPAWVNSANFASASFAVSTTTEKAPSLILAWIQYGITSCFSEQSFGRFIEPSVPSRRGEASDQFTGKLVNL